VLINWGAHHNIIGGTTTGSGNVISANSLTNVHLDHNDTHDNRIQGNLIGTNVAGTATLGNSRSGIGLGGSGWPRDTVIGGDDDDDGSLDGIVHARNVISGVWTPGNGGITLALRGTHRTLIQGNYIGTDITGNTKLGGNVYGGIYGVPASNVTVGGTTPGAGNVIADKLRIDTGLGWVIQGNIIGLNATGTARLGGGIEMHSPSNVIVGIGNSVIGGTSIAARNVVSYITISSGAHLDQPILIQGNYIGTDLTGTQSRGGGGGFGVGIDISCDNVIIGGTAPVDGTVSRGNTD
jgi:hypothetical protein